MATACEICGGNDVKYKCPVCVIRYCSVVCYKTHKENGCTAVKFREKLDERLTIEPESFGLVKEEGELSSSESETVDEDENGIDRRTLQQLGQSDLIKSMLDNPHLCDMIRCIDQSSNPEKALKDALNIPIFTEFADACLSICSSPKMK